MPATPLVTIHGTPSLPLQSDRIRAWLTPQCGMLAPVEFDLGNGRTARPYSLPPWMPHEVGSDQPPLMGPIRGDFFCFPFGTSNGVTHIHGPAANDTWTIVSSETASAELSLESPSPRASLRKRVHLRPGETNIYIEHGVHASGRISYATHPILQVPEGITAELRTSPFRFGSTDPRLSPRMAGEVGRLADGARFTSLHEVPLATGGTTSLARYPIRPNCEDVAMLGGFAGPHAWAALTFDCYVWFALRRVKDFPSTLFWMTNSGRSAAPWSSRHARRIGIEDICSHFCNGREVSAEDRLAAEGIPTSRLFDPAIPVRMPHVQGVVAIPTGFGGLASLEPVPGNPGQALFIGESGARVQAPLDWTFLDPATP